MNDYAGKRLKVAVDLTPLLPGGTNGGIKHAILELIYALQRFSGPSFSLFFITAASTHREVEEIACEHDQVMCIDRPEANAALTPSGFYEKGIDVYYAPFGIIRFPDCGIPIVAMVADLLHRDFPFSISEEERQRREEYFAEAIRCVSRFQVISDYTGQRLTHHYGVPAEKIFRTYLPIQNRLKVREIFGRSESRMFFYPANFWLHKNHEVLLIAFQIYRQQAGPDAWDLVLTGTNDGRCRDLKELALALGIGDYVDFKDYLSEEELGLLFSSAGALVFPSLHEGFGIPPLEAMKLGVPVLTSEVGSLREVVGEAALLVDPRNPTLLAQAMARIASSEQLREDLRCRGFQRVTNFSFETEVILLAETFVMLKRSGIGRLRHGLLIWLDGICLQTRAKMEHVYRSFQKYLKNVLLG